MITFKVSECVSIQQGSAERYGGAPLKWIQLVNEVPVGEPWVKNHKEIMGELFRYVRSPLFQILLKEQAGQLVELFCFICHS